MLTLRRKRARLKLALLALAGIALLPYGCQMLRPLPPGLDSGQLPMTFDISMAVRRDDTRLRIALDEVLKRRASEVERLLTRYGVPLGALSSARRSTRTLEY